jgi:hypothetical protein
VGSGGSGPPWRCLLASLRPGGGETRRLVWRLKNCRSFSQRWNQLCIPRLPERFIRNALESLVQKGFILCSPGHVDVRGESSWIFVGSFINLFWWVWCLNSRQVLYLNYNPTLFSFSYFFQTGSHGFLTSLTWILILLLKPIS